MTVLNRLQDWRLLCALMVVALSPMASAEDALPDALQAVVERVESAPVMQGHFQQSRQIEGLSRPLSSQGWFIVSQDHGLYWRQELPFLSEMWLSESRVQQRTREGAVSVMSLDDQPVMAAFVTLFLSLWQGDWQAMAVDFHRQVEAGDELWTVYLEPREASLVRVLQQVTIQGDSHPQRVVIVDATGNRSELLIDRVEQAERLSDRQRGYFDPQ